MTGHDMLMYETARCSGYMKASVSLHRHSHDTKPPHFLILLAVYAEDTSSIDLSLDPLEAAALAKQLEDTGLLAVDRGAFTAQVEFLPPDATRVAFLLRQAITMAGHALAGDIAPSGIAAVEPDA